MVGTLPPRCLQALPHGTKNAATDGPGYRATPRSTTEPHRGWMSDTYLLHLHAEGEKCFLLTSPFIEPAQNRRHPLQWAASAIICARAWPLRCWLVMQSSSIYQEQSWVKIVLFRLQPMPGREATSSSAGSVVSRSGLM